MALQVIEKLDALVPNSACMASALESLFPLCTVPSDLSMRTRLGVQLAICEFEAAGIPYPQSCIEPVDIFDCTRLLESKATWWTTFSGNYRHMSTICNEYRPHYEAQHVLKIYRNVSSLFVAYQEILERTVKKYESQSEAIASQADSIERIYTVSFNAEKQLAALINQAKEVTEMLALSSFSARNESLALQDLASQMNAAFHLYDELQRSTISQLANSTVALKSVELVAQSLSTDMVSFRDSAMDAIAYQSQLQAQIQSLSVELDSFANRQNSSVSLLEYRLGAAGSTIEEQTARLQSAVGDLGFLLAAVKWFAQKITRLVFVFFGIVLFKHGSFRKKTPELAFI